MTNKFEMAKAKLPLKGLMAHYGHGPRNDNWKDFECPFCHKKSGAGVFAKGGQDFFKCHHAGCPSGTAVAGGAVTEVGYVAVHEGMSEERRPSPAYKRYLELAGVWEEMPVRRSSAQRVSKPGQTSAPAGAQASSQMGGDEPSSAPGAENPMVTGASSAFGNAEGRMKNAEGGSTPHPGPLPGRGGEGESNPATGADNGSGYEGGPDSGGHENLPAEMLDALVDGSTDATSSETPGRALSGAGEAAAGGAASPPGQLGGEGESQPASAGAEPPEPEVEAARVLRVFYERLQLDERDKGLLWEKRGLTPEMAGRLGLRSNRQSNKEILLKLEEEFSTEALLASGLWVEEKGGVVKPNAQFYGWGVTGRKKVRGKDELEWDWCDPVLIPYFDRSGELTHLRPHKGMMRGKLPRVYAATQAGKVMGTFAHAVITEGEFKAGAGWQAVGNVLWLSLPGITMAKNWVVWAELKEWLSACEVQKVNVAYDSEEKGDPKLPGFKPDKAKRYESIIWARYLAEILVREGYDARVCLLPKEWQDGKGKADWDGALARLVKAEGRRQNEEGGSTPHPSPLHGRGGEGESHSALGDASPAGVWKRCASAVRSEFLTVLRSSKSSVELRQSELFDSEEERIIKNAVERLWYVAELPHGGEKETSIAQKLKRLRRTTLKDVPGLDDLASRYHGLSGWYYVLKPLKAENMEVMWKQRKIAAGKRDWDLVWYYDLRMKGRPERVADFRMDCDFVLVRSDGKRDRMVVLRNAQGEEKRMVPLDARSFVRPSDFREWLGNVGNFTWMAGERELQALQRDINHSAAFREVHQVTVRGYHEESRVWFFQDCAVSPEGELLFAGEDKVFWHGGLGYQLSERDKEGQELAHKEPLLQPDLDLDACAIDFADEARKETKGSARLTAFFQETTQRMRETLGGYEAFMAVGMILSYAAGPEIYRRYNALPGQWVHGQMGEGKTSWVIWLMSFWGFALQSGLGLRTSCSKPGMLIAAQQYSSLPVWFEEYRSGEVEKTKEGVLHAAYNRDTQNIKTPEGTQRRIRTAFIVSGESTSSDAALRSRYAHYQVSQTKREKNHYDWFQAHAKWFVAFTRELMKRRAEFVQLASRVLQEWMESPEMRQVDERAKMVHGVAYACFLAAAAIFESHDPAQLNDYKKFLQHHCVEAVQHVHTEVNINQFWSQLISAFKMGAFGESKAEYEKFFKVIGKRVAHAPLHENQEGWQNFRLFIEYNSVLAAMEAHLRKQGKLVPLERNDLRAQLAQCGYWLEPTKQRFGTGSGTSHCWVIDLDKHEMGYQPLTDEELEASRHYDDSGGRMTIDEWVDPRKGELFIIVSALTKQQEELGS